MILYHGTNKAFDTIDLTKSKPNKTILASEYQLYLPTEEQLIKEIDEVKAQIQSDKEEL